MNNTYDADLQTIKALQATLKQRLDSEQEQLTGLAKRLWAQQEAEKSRLSRELHDGVGQLLTGLTRRLHDLSAQQPELTALHSIAEMALADVRQLSRLMSPTILDDLGLQPALKWLCRSLLEHEQIDYHCQLDVNVEINKEISVLLFRIAQETLVNTVKHAQASKVELKLMTHHNVIRMELRDDGCGFDRAQIEPGVGLISIADRAKAFNATLSLESALHQGTSTIISVPL
ncbi:sensor histidine kinase [Salinimonas marina]|uniref:histidine kinase n=1 Tax=Salinimonas marina TaxID=2785918 RepID=A0A7S9DXY6_9ALTE|nr:histidine kinase [Salinimonas marina]QPG06043.1 sensor histidine kinase [Salinimonas marina]